MQNVTEAVQDELVKSLDYKLGSSNVNYIQSRKDVQYFPSSLSTFTPTTSRVARIPLTSGMDFIDPESIKIAFRVRNNSATLGLNPGTQEPSCFIKRVQLFANGQRCDDISEYGRCCFLYSLLKPQEWYRNKGIAGFWEVAGAPAPVPAESFKDVLMAPTLIGMFQAGKFLPPQLNLVLELEFAEAADALRPGEGSTDYTIENVRVLASQVTLDSALYESYQKILLSGRSLVFAYPTMHTQVSSIPAGSTSYNVTVARAFTKLLGAFVTFRDTASLLGDPRVPDAAGRAPVPPLSYGQRRGALSLHGDPRRDVRHLHQKREDRRQPVEQQPVSVRLPRGACPQAPPERHQHALRRPREVQLQKHAGGPRPENIRTLTQLSDCDGFGLRSVGFGLIQSTFFALLEHLV